MGISGGGRSRCRGPKARVRVCACVCARGGVCMHLRGLVYMCVCAHACVCACMYACVCVCVRMGLVEPSGPGSSQIPRDTVETPKSVPRPGSVSEGRGALCVRSQERVYLCCARRVGGGPGAGSLRVRWQGSCVKLRAWAVAGCGEPLGGFGQ